MGITSNLFYLLLIISFENSSSLREWASNTNLNNVLNWDLNRLPLNCDKITFQHESGLNSLWNLKDLSLSSLQLAPTGSVSFADGIKINFNDEEDCGHSKEIKFVRSFKHWLDPKNWNYTQGAIWKPHIERIPCSGETLVFPDGNSYGVVLPNVTLPVGNILFLGKEYGVREWSEYLQSDIGNDYFKGPDNIRSFPWRKSEGCSNPEGCACSEGAYTLLNGVYEDVKLSFLNEQVCKLITGDCDFEENGRCMLPVRPIGHCCDICGAVIDIVYKNKQDVKKKYWADLIKQELNTKEMTAHVQYHITLTDTSRMQLVFVDVNKDGGELSVEFGKHVFDVFQGLNLPLSISLQYSGPILSQSWTKEPPNIFFGSLFIILSLFGCIFYIFVIHPKKKLMSLVHGKPFTFARFENTLHECNSEENLEIGTELVQEPEIQAPLESTSKSFENPMFEQGASSSGTQLRVAESNQNFEQDENTEQGTEEDLTENFYSQLEIDESKNFDSDVLENDSSLIFEDVKF